MDRNAELFSRFANKTVVLDLSSPYVAIGEFSSADDNFVVLNNADIHDMRESRTTRDIYLIQAKENGIRVNRRSVTIRKEEIVAIAMLNDVT